MINATKTQTRNPKRGGASERIERDGKRAYLVRPQGPDLLPPSNGGCPGRARPAGGRGGGGGGGRLEGSRPETRLGEEGGSAWKIWNGVGIRWLVWSLVVFSIDLDILVASR